MDQKMRDKRLEIRKAALGEAQVCFRIRFRIAREVFAERDKG